MFAISDGRVIAAPTAMDHLGLMEIISRRPCQEREVIAALAVLKIIVPAGYSSSRVLFKTTSVGLRLHLLDCPLDRISRAMDWLIARKAYIERQLLIRHVSDWATVHVLETSCCYGRDSPLESDGSGLEWQTVSELTRAGSSRDANGETLTNYVRNADACGRP